MEKGHQDSEICSEKEKGVIEMHEKVGSSVEQNPDPENATKDPLWRHGINEKQEKIILRKLDIHLLPTVSLLYFLSFLYVSSCQLDAAVSLPPSGIVQTLGMPRLPVS
jgi:hypothetical protein